MTLTEFLLARIDEDAAAAQEEAERLAERWRQIAAAGMPAVVLTDWELGPGDTSRVLAECAAKRRIVEASVHHAQYNDGALGDHCRANLALLASVYADHEDYRQEWRP